MAYPASTKTLDAWLTKIDGTSANIKSSAQRLKTRCAAGEADIELVRRFYDELADASKLFAAAASATGLAAYAQTQKGDGGLDAAAEFVAMKNAINAIQSELRTSLPAGSGAFSGYKVAVNFPTDKTQRSSLIVFTSAQTATLQALLDTLIAAIS